MHDKTYNKTCATSEDSDQPAHPRSLIRVFADRMCLLQPPGYPKKYKRGPSPYWMDVQADLSLCWSHRSYCRFCRAQAHIIMLIWEADVINMKYGALQKYVKYFFFLHTLFFFFFFFFVGGGVGGGVLNIHLWYVCMFTGILCSRSAFWSVYGFENSMSTVWTYPEYG